MNLNTFRNNITKPAVDLRYKFTYEGTDYTDLVLDLPTITRNINLAAGKATIVVNNSSGFWNFLHKTNNALGGTAQIKVYINGDASNELTLLKGKIQRPKWMGAKIRLVIRDHSGDWLNIKLGSNYSPINYYSIDWFPDSLAWDILTNHAGLDSTSNPSNTDIDYTSFAAWRDQHVRANLYETDARPTGHFISNILMKICQISHSFIWVNNDGKVAFAPPFQPGYSYNEGNALVDLSMNEDHILNSVSAQRAFNPSTGKWTELRGPSTDATSIARFGTFPKVIEDRVVWHETNASADEDRNETITDYAFPLRFFDIMAGPPAIMEDLCNVITVNDTLLQVTNAAPRIEEITYDLDSWIVTMKARWTW